MASYLERPITIDELDDVVKALKLNKSPGWDGLTTEFYKKFWDVIRPLLYRVYCKAIENFTLPPSQRIGIITLLPKPKSIPELKHI